METSLAEISKQIYLVRGTRVMLDSDLASHYQTETRILNQTVRRHSKKFPEDFMFQVTRSEFETLKSQIVISRAKRGGRQTLPLVFTEQGVRMLSCVMDNDTAVEFSVLAVRAFAQTRQASESHIVLAKKVDHLERSFQEFKQVFAQFENKVDTYFGLYSKHEQGLPVQPVPINDIGKIFGKDHTTILYAYRKVSNAVCRDGLICESIEAIERFLQVEAK